MEKRVLTCIGCPLGCEISVTLDKGNVTDVVGYTCNRGLNYAKKEVVAPERTFTGSIKIIGGTVNKVSVKTDKEISKSMMLEVAKKVKTLKVKAPVKIGDIVAKNIAGTKSNIIITKNVSILNCK